MKKIKYLHEINEFCLLLSGSGLTTDFNSSLINATAQPPITDAAETADEVTPTPAAAVSDVAVALADAGANVVIEEGTIETVKELSPPPPTLAAVVAVADAAIADKELSPPPSTPAVVAAAAAAVEERPTTGGKHPRAE